MSDMIREYFFTVPIFYIDVENSKEINRKLIHDILEWKKEDEKGTERSNNHGWHSQDDMNLRDEFEDIKNVINDKLNSISLMEQYSSEADLVIEGMWANVSPKYAYNSYHFHHNSLWSGVYYVQSPPNSGKILFHKEWSRYQGVPKPTFSSSPPVHTHQWDSVSYEPIEGRVILFPSWIGHQVGQNLTDVEGEDGYRISISFNIKQIDDTRWYLN